jgi:CubicO group peptidase (beta-lactamase class C family)
MTVIPTLSKRLYIITPYACLLLLLPFMVAGSVVAQETVNTADNLFKRWSDSIPGLMKQKKVHGMALAVVDRSGIIWTECFGYTDSTHSRCVDSVTLFSVQSMSKNLTAMAVLKAVSDGLLDLDGPVTAYLPGFAVNSRYESTPQDKMTMRLLLSHRAGFTHEAPVGNNYYNEGSFDDHIKSISDTWLRFPAGQRYSYSNLGVDLAGYILANMAGENFDDYLKKNILSPCNMPHSSFDMTLIEMEKNRAKGYSGPDREAPFYFAMKPSGGLYTSIIDIAHYVMVHLNNGKQGDKTVVPEVILSEMYNIPDPLPDQISGYGLGLSIRNDYGVTLMNHGGSGFGFCSNMIWSPEYGVGIVMLTNASYIDFQNSLPMAILSGVIEQRTGRSIEQEFPASRYDMKEVTVDSLCQKAMAGSYLYNRNGVMILEYCDNRLGIKPEGPGFYPAIFTSEEDFNFGPGPFPTFFSIYAESINSPGYLVRHFDSEYLDRNDGPFDQPGPAKEDWLKYTGKYSYWSQGRKSPNRIPVTMKNGYLYIYDFRLTEYLPGLFFTAHGEAADFRSSQVTWRNIKITKEE